MDSSSTEPSVVDMSSSGEDDVQEIPTQDPIQLDNMKTIEKSFRKLLSCYAKKTGSNDRIKELTNIILEAIDTL